MDEKLPREDSFDIVVRGYNRQQVLEYMGRSNQLLAQLEQQLAVARADVQRARSDAEAARSEVQQLRAAQREAKPVHEEVSGRLSQILKLAAEEADQERATADAEIAKLRHESQTESERMITEARAESERRLAQAHATAESQLAQARQAADHEVRSAHQEAERLRSISEQQSAELIDEAQRRAGAVNEVSGQRLETLTATHGEAVLRLGQIRDVLADLLTRDSSAGSLSQVVDSVVGPPVVLRPELNTRHRLTEGVPAAASGGTEPATGAEVSGFEPDGVVDVEVIDVVPDEPDLRPDAPIDQAEGSAPGDPLSSGGPVGPAAEPVDGDEVTVEPLTDGPATDEAPTDQSRIGAPVTG